jgi:hypothetical protein
MSVESGWNGHGNTSVMVATLLFVLLAAPTVATAANLVNKGGSSDVPTMDGRVYYIKPSGASCPGGFNCFCNSGSQCTLPGSGIITGTVIIDRPGVTLDCQNRIIQAPRFANSRQVCSQLGDCGSGPGSWHPCVNGYCQLDNLAGINIGGPANVDDSPINIDVNATGYVQDVTVVNCIVRSFSQGYNVDGALEDNGLDQLEILNSEFRTNDHGITMRATDSSLIYDVWSHDNYGDGMRLRYNWGLTLQRCTSESNRIQLFVYAEDVGEPFEGNNRWFTSSNGFYSDSAASSLPAVVIDNVEAAGSLCNGTARCDTRLHQNYVAGAERGIEIGTYLTATDLHSPTTEFTFNTTKTLFPKSWSLKPHVRADVALTRKCWDRGNVCFDSTTSVACREPALFTPTTCQFH